MYRGVCIKLSSCRQNVKFKHIKGMLEKPNTASEKKENDKVALLRFLFLPTLHFALYEKKVKFMTNNFDFFSKF